MKRILLADDDKNVNRSVDILLTLDGYETMSVYNGEEALQKLLQQKFDLLITDLIMPQLDGIELITRVRKFNNDLPIMVLSGQLNAKLIKLLKKKRIFHVLPKPINPVHFRKMIQKVFR
ncbi:MAG: response regulator [Calditrichaeota bacterium]|nr:response regulator [Calditrichota bacterium]RQW02937.1 MAG: response regulator [Calditrichota bacterium]